MGPFLMLNSSAFHNLHHEVEHEEIVGLVARAAASAMEGAPPEPSPSVDDLVQVLLPTAMKGPVSFGDGYSYHPVYEFAAAAVVLRRVRAWLDAGAYDVVI